MNDLVLYRYRDRIPLPVEVQMRWNKLCIDLVSLLSMYRYTGPVRSRFADVKKKRRGVIDWLGLARSPFSYKLSYDTFKCEP